MKNSKLSLEQKPGLKFESISKPGVILKLALLQFLSAVVVGLVLYFCSDTRDAVSAFLGGLIAAITSLYMAGRLFATRRVIDPPEMLVRFYSSVVLKVLFTLAMMAICIIVLKVALLPFIIAYLIAAVIVNILFLLVPVHDVSTSVVTEEDPLSVEIDKNR